MNHELLAIVSEMEKDADVGMFSRARQLPGEIAAGISGFLKGSRGANAQHRMEGAARRIAANPHADPHQVAEATKLISGNRQQNPGFFSRLHDEFTQGAQVARQNINEHSFNRDREILRGINPQAAQAFDPRQQGGPGFVRKYVVPTAKGVAGVAALGGLGYAGYRGYQAAHEQDARAQDYMHNMGHDMNSALPSMTVTASYEKFANYKLASPAASRFQPVMLGSAHAAVAKSLSDTLGQKLVADPIDALADTVKRRVYDEPRWSRNFNEVVKGDPMLAQIHAQNPATLGDAFESVKRFSPTLARDRLGTRNLLRHVAMSGGELDHSTMKMLAETEKFMNESKRRG
jgi:hypothetical protein